ncbi:transcription antitermination factor NusB [Thermoanaerobacterium sp. DL9XJH110]|uniref:transcription antitermination factor NusB n=1 Tax=Thermoanaerobacterium sp. DL9XJH110 TaxID=3386643 RepID=UPI003BB660E8
MSRKIARENAFKILFAVDLGDNTIEEAAEIAVTRPVDQVQREFMFEEVKGVLANIKMIDSIIESYSVDWKVERIPAVDRNILRLAIYEMLFCEDIPVSVSINEAVEMAKKYGEQQSYKFINGILGTVAKERGKSVN